MQHLIDEPRVSAGELLKSAGQLSAREFERFASDILTLRARRVASSLPRGEARLISRINQGLPPKLRARLESLVPKRAAGTLTDAELDELKNITNQIETIELRRVKDLAALARLRKTNLAGVMKQLEIQVPTYA